MYADLAQDAAEGSGDSAQAWVGMRAVTSPIQNIGHSMGALIRVSLACIVALTGLAMASVPASAQGTVKSVHGDWQIRCDTPPGAQGEQCALIQSVTAEDRPNVGLNVNVPKPAAQHGRLHGRLAP